MLRARAAPKLTVEEHIEDSAIIHGRVGDMNHVFLNLLDNAVRAAGDEGSVRVDAWAASESYFVRVGDSGPGISPEAAERIFEPFFTTRPAGEGTGLGLAIARQVVHQAGGDIELERSALGGAAFVVRIPTGKPRALAAQAPPN
jgi:signal transduction histidine kinase